MNVARALLCLLYCLPACLLANEDKIIDQFWFDGAEINRYALEQSLYGGTHTGHAELIFVTEPFLVKQQVKRDYGKEPATPVLKLNALRTFNTGIYSYRTMSTTFQPIALDYFPYALKSTTSVQDWCGQAYLQLNRLNKGWAYELRSYFQSEGDQKSILPEAYLEDALWCLIRLKPGMLPTGSFEIIPGGVYARFSHQPLRPYTAVGTLVVAQKRAIYTLHYPDLERKLSIEFDNKFPHIIRSWEETTPDGTTRATLEDRIMNSYYWQQNQPEDASKRKQLGLSPTPQ